MIKWLFTNDATRFDLYATAAFAGLIYSGLFHWWFWLACLYVCYTISDVMVRRLDK